MIITKLINFISNLKAFWQLSMHNKNIDLTNIQDIHNVYITMLKYKAYTHRNKKRKLQKLDKKVKASLHHETSKELEIIAQLIKEYIYKDYELKAKRKVKYENCPHLLKEYIDTYEARIITKFIYTFFGQNENKGLHQWEK